MDTNDTKAWNDAARDADDRDLDKRDDASEVEGGAATGAIVGTAFGGPVGLAAGAATGAIVGGAAEAEPDEDADFDRTAEPGTGERRGIDLRDPQMGGHVGGSDPEHA